MPHHISSPFGSFHPTFSLYCFFSSTCIWNGARSPALQDCPLLPTPITSLGFTYACVLSPFTHVWLFGNPMDRSLQGCFVRGIFRDRILLEWVAMPSSRGKSSWPRDRIHVSCIAGKFFTTEPLGKPIFWPVSYTSEVPTAPSSGSTNLLE